MERLRWLLLYLATAMLKTNKVKLIKQILMFIIKLQRQLYNSSSEKLAHRKTPPMVLFKIKLNKIY